MLQYLCFNQWHFTFAYVYITLDPCDFSMRSGTVYLFFTIEQHSKDVLSPIGGRKYSNFPGIWNEVLEVGSQQMESTSNIYFKILTLVKKNNILTILVAD